VLSFVFLEILEKIAGMTGVSRWGVNHDLHEDALADFPLVSRTGCVG